MSDVAIEDIEAAMRFGRTRSELLAEDVANARTPGFVAKDALLVPQDGDGAPFGTVYQDVVAQGSVGVLEYAMGAQARNAVTYHELAAQERAMLHELRTVAEESRR